LSLLPLLQLVKDGIVRRPLNRPAIVCYFACEALMLWLHSLGPLFGLTMTLALAVTVLRPGLKRGDWGWLIGGQVLVGLLYLPAFLIMLHQAKTWVKTGWVVFDASAVPITVAQIWLDWNSWACLIAGLLAAAGAALLLRRIGGIRLLAALLLMAVLPVLLSIILSATVSPVFLARTLSPTAIPALLLVGLGVAWPGRGAWAAPIAFALVAASMVWIDREQAEGGPPQDWYGTLAWLEPRMAPGDVVWAYPNESALPLAYALQDRHRAMPLQQVPAPIPALSVPGFHPTGGMGAVSLYPAQIDRLMTTREARRPPTIWLLRLSPELYDKGDGMLHALERERVEVGHFQSREIDLIGLRRMDLAPVAAAQQAQP
jgi:mannosyltransferase